MSKLNLLKDIKIGAIFGDEMHYGGRTANYQNLKDTFKPALDLAVTATPTRFLLNQYKHKYIFTEWQRQYLKQQGFKDFQDAVTPVQFTVKFDEIISSVDTKFGEEKVTNMSGVVLSDDTEVRKQLINLLWLDEKYKGVDGKAKYNMFNLNNVIKNCSGTNYSDKELKHGIAILPMNSKKIIEFVKIANSMQNEYLFIATTAGKITDGKHVLGEKLEDVIKNKDNENIKTVTCTCYMFIEGVTVPEWNYIVWLDNNKSTSKYFQGSGRGLSQNKKHSKEYAFIFDFDWNRCLVLNDEMMKTAMAYSEINNTDDFIAEYGLHSNPIFLYINGKYQEIASTTEYHELLSEAIRNSDRVEYILDEFEDDEIIENEDILKALIAQDKTLSMNLSTNKTNLEKFSESYKKVAEKKRNNEKLDTEEKKLMITVAELKNKLRTIISCIPELALCTEETTFEDILNNSKNEKLISLILNISQENLNDLFKNHDTSKINMIINNMYNDFNAMDRYEFEAAWLAPYTGNSDINENIVDTEVARNIINYENIIF